MSDTGEDSKANIKPEGASDPNVLSIKVKDQLGGEVRGHLRP